MKLVEVDVVSPQALETSISRHQQVSMSEVPRQGLGRYEDTVPEIPYGFANYFFRPVGFGGINQTSP